MVGVAKVTSNKQMQDEITDICLPRKGATGSLKPDVMHISSISVVMRPVGRQDMSTLAT